MLIKIAIIALAGALGSVSRWGISSAVANALGQRAHYGTLAVNVIGCLLFGFMYERLTQSSNPNEHLQLFFLTGFMGAFTTFSAFAFDTHSLHSSSGPFAAGSNILLNLVFGILALALGFLLGKIV
jgi:CrcB protein